MFMPRFSGILRLAIHLLLCSEWEGIATFLATVCGSWVPVNRGSTGRTILTPLGNENFAAVRKANKMVSRIRGETVSIVCSKIHKILQYGL